MSSLVVKRGLSPTLAIVKSFHLAIMSTEKIELMGMEVCLLASQPALTAIKLKLKQKVNLWLLKCLAPSMPLLLLPPFVHLEVTKPTWSLSTLCHKFPNMLIGIGGDMNLPDIERETEQLTTNQYTHSISYSFLDTIANTGIQQIVNFPTRNNNTLDVVLTNHPSMAKQCVGMPRLSDHDIVFVETRSRAFRHKPARRKILIRKHANFDDIRASIMI